MSEHRSQHRSQHRTERRTERRTEHRPEHRPEHRGHGSSVAAWTGVGILLVAALVMSIAVVIASPPLFVVGAVLAVVGVAAGKVLAMAGFGSKAGTRAAAEGEQGPPLPEPGRTQADSGIQ